jgi:CubicO group peptidase (beta-lactamase class C family)
MRRPVRHDRRMLFGLLLAVSAPLSGPGSLIGIWDAQRDYTAASAAGNQSRLRVRQSVRPSVQWVQPGNADNPSPIAIPVAATAALPDAWQGTIQAIPDVQHLRLFIQPAPAGGLTAFVRNPERNVGAFIGTRSVSLSGSTVRLQRTGASDIVGSWSPNDRNSLTLRDPILPGTFIFTRESPAPVARPYAYRMPAAGADGWPVGSLSDAGFDEPAIARIVDDIAGTMPGLKAPFVQGLLIERHGKLVLDEYFNGYDADRPHDVRSAGKSVTTLLVGRAISDGAPFSPDTRIATILTSYVPFQNDDARKQAVTVANLMSMSAGYACDDNDDASPGNEDRMQTQNMQSDWYRYTLDLPMLFAPGTRALYCSAEINLLGAIVAKETGRWLPEYFYERFARPMEFGVYGMWLVPPPVDDAYMAGGDLFRPRDFLKFGELFLRRGRWHDTPVIDPAWLTLVSTKHAYVEGGGGDYGYGWHLDGYTYRGRTVRAINAGGNGGQLLYAFPDLDLAIMITGGNYNQYPVWHSFQTKLVPAVLQTLRFPNR